MSTIQNLFEQAQLAEAAYANFIDPQTGLPYTSTNGITDALQDTGNNLNFSATQAAIFVARYQVVSQQPDTTKGVSIALLSEQPCHAARALN